MAKPSFITTKGERNRQPFWDTQDILARVEDIYAGKFVIEGEGLPEDMPADYPARALFRHGAIQLKDTDIGRVLVPVKAAERNIYGRPVKAVPTGLEGFRANSNLLEASDAPVCMFEYTPSYLVDRYVRMMDRSLQVLDQNLVGLSQPVLVQGTQGGEINNMVMESTIADGDIFIPCLDKVVAQAQVLDLNAQDHTQNLIGVFRAMYAETLTVIGTQGSGSEKASGMTTEETTSVMQQVNMHTYSELAVLQQWCDKVNGYFEDCDISVRLGEGWTVSMEDDPAEARNDKDDETETDKS